jgi:Omp85 superfamily domain
MKPSTQLFMVVSGMLGISFTGSAAMAAGEVSTNSTDSSVTNSPALPTTNAPAASKLIDPQDGWLDASGFLDTAYGFIPIVSPITEPAVGYGAAGGLVFIGRKDPTPGEPPEKPRIVAVGGAGTENGTWAGFGAWSDSWMKGKLETLVAGGFGQANLGFYGIGADSALHDNPADYNLKPFGGIVEGRYRIGDSRAQVGLRYTFADTKVSFVNSPLPPQISPSELESRIGGLSPALIYDSRNNTFTPTKGTYARADFGFFAEALGGSSDYEMVGLTFINYQPLAPTLTLGLKTEAQFSFDNAPFYTLPFIDLRGVAVRRYVGQDAADGELEARWQCWGRFSLVGFTGAGIAWNNFERLQSQETVVTGGVGFRYELARKYGLHMGMDVAFGPNSPAFYIQFGSAWSRP